MPSEVVRLDPTNWHLYKGSNTSPYRKEGGNESRSFLMAKGEAKGIGYSIAYIYSYK